MNISRLFLVVTVVALVILASCKKVKFEEPAPITPSLSVTINGVDSLAQLVLDIGDTLKISGEVTAPLGIDTYESYYVDETQFFIERYLPGNTVVNSLFMKNYQRIIDFTWAGKEVEFTFSVTDTTGAKAEHVFILNVNESPIISRSNVVASPYGQFYKGNLYNIIGDTLYFPINVKTNVTNQKAVDLIFAHDAVAGYSVSSPADVDADTIWNDNVNFSWPFVSVSSTDLIKLSDQVNFDRIATAKQIVDLYKGSTTSILSGLYVGEIIGIQLDTSKGSKLGILRITNIVGNNKSERQITFDLKFEQ